MGKRTLASLGRKRILRNSMYETVLKSIASNRTFHVAYFVIVINIAFAIQITISFVNRDI